MVMEVLTSANPSMSAVEGAISLLTAEECVVTLAKVLDNILLEERYEKKTRKFKMSNETFNRRVVRHPGGLDVLIACRFTKKGQALQLKKEHESKMVIWNARRALQTRAEYLGFVLTKVPPMPTNLLSDNCDRFESTSVYETSTIATIDELDMEIAKELEDSPISTVPCQSAISPVGTPAAMPTSALLAENSSSIASLEFPKLQKYSTEVSPTQTPLAPRSSSKRSDDKPERSGQAGYPLRNETSEVRSAGEPEDDPYRSRTTHNEMHHEMSPGDWSQASADGKGATSEVSLSIPRVSVMNNCVAEETDHALIVMGTSSHHPKSFQVKSESFAVDDPLLKEMNKALTEDGWAEDGSYLDDLDDLDVEVTNDIVVPIVGNLSLPISNCDSQEEAKPMGTPKDADLEAVTCVPTAEILSLPTIGTSGYHSMQDDGLKHVWLTDDCLLQEMEAELNGAHEIPIPYDYGREMQHVRSCSKEKSFLFSPAPQFVELVAADSARSTHESVSLSPTMGSEPKQYQNPSNGIVSHTINGEGQSMPSKCPVQITEERGDSKRDADPVIAVQDEAVHAVVFSQALFHMSEIVDPQRQDAANVESVSLTKEAIQEMTKSIEEELQEAFVSLPPAYSSRIATLECEGQAHGSEACDTHDAVEPGMPVVSHAQDGLADFFSTFEMPLQNSDEDLPSRSKMLKSPSGDDLEKEMASVLARCLEVPAYTQKTRDRASDCVAELDTDGESVFSERNNKPGAPVSDDRSIPELIMGFGHFELGTGAVDDHNYSSVHAHSDWLKLNELMKRNSLMAEFEACWGSICTLSVVCADLPTEEFGLCPPGNRRSRQSFKNRPKRSWLPLELVQGLWSLVLSSEEYPDSIRIAYACSKLHEVLVESQYLEIHDKESLPHSTWVRVRKEKLVLLGFALPVSISKQSEWMRKLAIALAGDNQFWYGRYALPTIAIAGGDDEEKVKSLLRDVDFVQSRLDVIGIVSGTRRHILDCRSYIQARRQKFKDRKFGNDAFQVDVVGDASQDVALDACQQVATCLYRQGQLLSKSTASAVQMMELADALRLVGTAVGEWGDWEMEMQLYQKIMKVLHECGCSSTECMADTLLSMGHCHLGQGNYDTAYGCYEEALDIYRNRLGANSNKVAQAYHHMGVIYCERGEFESALEIFKTSLKIQQLNSMKDNYDEKTSDTLCWIGKVYRERDLPVKAKKYFDAARDVKEEIFGPDSLEVAETLHCIAVLYDDGHDFERGLRYYRKSLKIRRAALGDQHEDVCDTISCIGNVYKAMGDPATALKVFRRANDLRSSVARTSPLKEGQTMTLIRSHEDLLEILRIQVKTSKNPETERDEISSILLKMGHIYDTINVFSKCDRCFDKALELRMSSGDDVKAGQVLNVMGISFAKRQKHSHAMKAFEHALDLKKKRLGEGHLDVAETLHNMGNCAAKSGDLNDARAYYDEALRIKRKHGGTNSTSIAQTLHNIGNVLVAQGSNDGAMKHYNEALTLRRNALGRDSVEVAYTLHCIAKINRKQHDIDAARENFNASLRIKRLKLHKNHPSIAETLEQLGSIYMDIGEEEEGTLCLNAALNIYKTKHGEGVKIAHVYEQLGSKHERKQSIANALVYFSRSLRVRARVFGEEHVSVAEMHYRIGKLQRDQKLYHEALASFQAATRIRKKSTGRDDLVISDILTDAGALQIKLGQVDVAEKCFGEALRIRSLFLDPRHEKIAECMTFSGDVLVEKRKYTEAIGVFLDALGIFQDNAGDFGMLCADAYQRLGRVYTLTRDFDKALDHYEKCLKVHQSRHGDNDFDVAKVNHGLGEVYFARGDYRRAEDCFRESVEVMVAKLGENHLDVANAVLFLGRTCNKLNSPDEATMYFEQARLTKHHHLGDNHLEVFEIDLEIGRCHVIKKEYEEALQAFQSYLRARRSSIGDDEVVCNILLEIGTVEYDLGRYDAALSSLASALTLYRALLGDDQVPVANALYLLGVVYEAKHAYQESMKYHKEAFRLRRRLLGPDDLLVAQSLDKISILYMNQPNLEKALQSIKEVLRIRTQKLGKDHIDVSTSLFGMGVIFSESDQLDKAMECYRVSLKIRTQHLGEASVEVAQTLHNMGTVFGKQQDFESALEHWRRALVSYREAGFSDEDHLVAVTIGNINMAEAYLEDTK